MGCNRNKCKILVVIIIHCNAPINVLTQRVGGRGAGEARAGYPGGGGGERERGTRGIRQIKKKMGLISYPSVRYIRQKSRSA